MRKWIKRNVLLALFIYLSVVMCIKIVLHGVPFYFIGSMTCYRSDSSYDLTIFSNKF